MLPLLAGAWPPSANPRYSQTVQPPRVALGEVRETRRRQLVVTPSLVCSLLMNEADRVAAERAAQKRNAELRSYEQRVSQQTFDIDDLAARARELIPRALEAKARKNYDGIVQVELRYPRTGITGLWSSRRDRTELKGAYKVWERLLSSERQNYYMVHLTSDGLLTTGGEHLTLDEYVRRVRNGGSDHFSITTFSSIVATLDGWVHS